MVDLWATSVVPRWIRWEEGALARLLIWAFRAGGKRRNGEVTGTAGCLKSKGV